MCNNIGYVTEEPNIYVCGYENLECNNKDIHRVCFQEIERKHKGVRHVRSTRKYKLYYDKDGNMYFNFDGKIIYINHKEVIPCATTI